MAPPPDSLCYRVRAQPPSKVEVERWCQQNPAVHTALHRQLHGSAVPHQGSGRSLINAPHVPPANTRTSTWAAAAAGSNRWDTFVVDDVADSLPPRPPAISSGAGLPHASAQVSQPATAPRPPPPTPSADPQGFSASQRPASASSAEPRQRSSNAFHPSLGPSQSAVPPFVRPSTPCFPQAPDGRAGGHPSDSAGVGARALGHPTHLRHPTHLGRPTHLAERQGQDAQQDRLQQARGWQQGQTTSAHPQPSQATHDAVLHHPAASRHPHPAWPAQQQPPSHWGMDPESKARYTSPQEQALTHPVHRGSCPPARTSATHHAVTNDGFADGDADISDALDGPAFHLRPSARPPQRTWLEGQQQAPAGPGPTAALGWWLPGSAPGQAQQAGQAQPQLQSQAQWQAPGQAPQHGHAHQPSHGLQHPQQQHQHVIQGRQQEDATLPGPQQQTSSVTPQHHARVPQQGPTRHDQQQEGWQEQSHQHHPSALLPDDVQSAEVSRRARPGGHGFATCPPAEVSPPAEVHPLPPLTALSLEQQSSAIRPQQHANANVTAHPVPQQRPRPSSADPRPPGVPATARGGPAADQWLPKGAAAMAGVPRLDKWGTKPPAAAPRPPAGAARPPGAASSAAGATPAHGCGRMVVTRHPAGTAATPPKLKDQRIDQLLKPIGTRGNPPQSGGPGQLSLCMAGVERGDGIVEADAPVPAEGAAPKKARKPRAKKAQADAAGGSGGTGRAASPEHHEAVEKACKEGRGGRQRSSGGAKRHHSGSASGESGAGQAGQAGERRSGSGPAAKRAKALAAAEEQLAALSEHLALDDLLLVDASRPTAFRQLRAAAAAARVVSLAVVHQHRVGPVTQYTCCGQPLSKAQGGSLRKARGLAAKHAAVIGAGDDGGAGLLEHGAEAAQGPAIIGCERVLGVAVLCVSGDQCVHLGAQLVGSGHRVLLPLSDLPADMPVYLVPWQAPQPPGQLPAGQALQPADHVPATQLLAFVEGLVTEGCGQQGPRPQQQQQQPWHLHGLSVCCGAQQLLQELIVAGGGPSSSSGAPGVQPAQPLATSGPGRACAVSGLVQRCCVVDPCVLAWLFEPQLVQQEELEAYTLHHLAARHGLVDSSGPAPCGAAAAAWALSNSTASGAAGGAAPASPGVSAVTRLRRSLLKTLQLTERMVASLAGWLPPRALQVEMQVTCLLAQMGALGVACDAGVLRGHRQQLDQRIAAVRTQAVALVGRDFNLSSSQQLAEVLYTDLHLPLPTTTGRDRTRQHASTDEAALRQLAHRHPLPGLILQHRSLTNAATKFLDPEWVGEVARRAAAANCNYDRVYCSWNQTATATGRLSSSGPNLQAVTKYVVDDVNIRDAFCAPPGRVLIAADYSQIELRVLSHLSNDPQLVDLLRAQGDVFCLIAKAWMHSGTGAGPVSGAERERAKRVVYGTVYGLTPFGLSQQLAAQGVDVGGAAQLINSFLNHFSGVKAFSQEALKAAQNCGYVSTIIGRRRPIQGLHSYDAKVRAEAQRKVVNTIVQGSAADLIKLAMCRWSEVQANASAGSPDLGAIGAVPSLSPSAAAPGVWHGRPAPLPAAPVAANSAAWQAGQPAADGRADAATMQLRAVEGALLVGQIHDELLFEVDASPVSVRGVAAVVREVMQGVAALRVPLLVNIKVGQRWGSMVDLDVAP